jgi:tRNA threonylcarbamoyl adenosine modification protein (Sua5/YciO/YrdC/YwlC family)
VAIPTDTVYGLAAARDDEAAIERIITLKRRPADKGIALLLADAQQAAVVGTLTEAAVWLARELWPGGLTLVVPIRGDARLAAGLVGDRGTIGLRVPDHPCPRHLAAVLGPVAATSANISGRPEAVDPSAIAELFGAGIDLIVDGGPAIGGRASTVVDCSVATPRVVRQGAVAADRIEAILRAAGVGR